MAASLQPLTISYLFDTRKYLILAIVMALVLVGVTIFMTVPQIQESYNLYLKSGVEQQKLTKLQAKVTQLKAVSDPQIQSQVQLVNTLLPANKPLLETLNGVALASTQSQVKVTSVRLQPGNISTDSASVADVTPTGPTQSMEVDISIQGTLTQLNQFFETIEKTTPLITITQLTLSPLEGAGILGGDVTVFDQVYSSEVKLSAAYFTQSVNSSVDSDLPQVTVDQQKILDDLATFTIIPDIAQPNVQGGGLEDLFGIKSPDYVVR